MFARLATRRRPAGLSRRAKARTRAAGARHLAVESLEARQMLSAVPMTFQVVDDASLDKAFVYAANGAAQGSTNLAAGNTAPRGVASTVAVEKTWVVDANRNVYVYSSTSGALLGSWSAGSLAANATPEGIATDGNDVWIVDAKNLKVFRYAGAATRTSGSQNAASSFNLTSSNSKPKDIVTDGYSLWVVDDGSSVDRVFKYNVAGGWVVGSWTIDSANKTPTGIALDPANIGDLWIADSGTDRVYKYAGAAGRDGGSMTAASSFALASGNGNPQGLVVPGRPWAETPYQVEWVRQFGTTGEDVGRAVTTDSAGNVYVAGYVNGSLTEPNPTGVSVPFFAKYDSSGALQWVQQFAAFVDAPYGGGKIATDDLGNVFLATGHGGPNEAPVNPPTTVHKYDADGNLHWSTPLPLRETGAGIAADNLGDVYHATFDLTPDSPDNGSEYINVRKFNGATGEIVWTRRLHVGPGPNNTSTMSYDGLGNIYVAAYTSGSVIAPSAGGQDAVVAKYTIDGEFVWARQFGTPAHDNNFQVAADSLGNVWSTGGAYGPLGGPYAGGQDVYLAMHNAAGELQWIRHWGTTGEEINAKIWADGQGNVFLATSSTATLAGPNLGGEDIVVAKYDAAGNQLWAKQFGTGGNEIPSGGGISGDSQGNLYITGRTSSSWGGPNAGGDDVVLVKLSAPQVASADLAVTMAAPSAGTEGELTAFTLTVTNNGPSAATGVVLTDALGANWLFSSAAASQGTFSQSGGVVTFNVGALGVGQTATAQVIARAVEPGSLTNSASVTSGAADANLANNATSRTVAVAAAPIVVSGSPLTVSGKKFNNITTATFTHAGGVHDASYYIATINWGDGTTSTGTITKSGSTFAVTGSKTYAGGGGTYVVSTTIERAIAPAAASSQQSLDLAFAAMAWEAQQDGDASDATLPNGKAKKLLA